MEEKEFVGYSYGRFKDDQGRMRDYCNIFVLEPFSGSENDDYHFSGRKAVKYGCVSTGVFEGIDVGTRVMCFFDSKKKVSYMVLADKVAAHRFAEA